LHELATKTFGDELGATRLESYKVRGDTKAEFFLKKINKRNMVSTTGFNWGVEAGACTQGDEVLLDVCGCHVALECFGQEKYQSRGRCFCRLEAHAVFGCKVAQRRCMYGQYNRE
jgi:hypothetical protein